MDMNLNPLDQLDPVVIVAVALILVVTLLLLKRVFIVPYVRVMEERALRLENAEEHLAEGRRLHEQSDSEAEAALADARAEADALRQASAEAMERYRSDALAQATAAAATQLEEGRTRIQAERSQEAARLRNSAIDCVSLACEQLVGGVDRQTVETVVDDLIARTRSGGASHAG